MEVLRQGPWGTHKNRGPILGEYWSTFLLVLLLLLTHREGPIFIFILSLGYNFDKMARLMSLLGLWLYLFPLALSADFESVTISRDLDNVGHTCISKCLYFTIVTDMGKAMGCDDPYDNNCYCATASASASQADAWMSKCASNTCSAGDRSRDLSSMQSIYASYCMAAGFTQPGATKWYNPAEATNEPEPTSGGDDNGSNNAEPSKTADSDSVESTTHLTIVTQTTEGGAGPSKSRGKFLLLMATVPLLLLQVLCLCLACAT